MVFTVCIDAVVPLYVSPDETSEQTDEMLFGDRAEIIDENNDFYKIITDYRYIGWAKKGFLRESLPEPTHFVSSRFADLLAEKRFMKKTGIMLPYGAKICASIDSHRFAETTLDGKKYYIHKNHLSPITFPQNENDFREQAVNTAIEYLGTQYRWGGRTHCGIDCSGLCFNAYRFCGADVWRDAKIELSPNLRRIDLDQAKRGDLIFFKGHIAMYLGGGRIIHSSATAGRVVSEKYDDNEILKEIYICAGTLF